MARALKGKCHCHQLHDCRPHQPTVVGHKRQKEKRFRHNVCVSGHGNAVLLVQTSLQSIHAYYSHCASTAFANFLFYPVLWYTKYKVCSRKGQMNRLPFTPQSLVVAWKFMRHENLPQLSLCIVMLLPAVVVVLLANIASGDMCYSYFLDSWEILHLSADHSTPHRLKLAYGNKFGNQLYMHKVIFMLIYLINVY